MAELLLRLLEVVRAKEYKEITALRDPEIEGIYKNIMKDKRSWPDVLDAHLWLTSEIAEPKVLRNATREPDEFTSYYPQEDMNKRETRRARQRRQEKADVEAAAERDPQTVQGKKPKTMRGKRVRGKPRTKPTGAEPRPENAKQRSRWRPLWGRRRSKDEDGDYYPDDFEENEDYIGTFKKAYK